MKGIEQMFIQWVVKPEGKNRLDDIEVDGKIYYNRLDLSGPEH
jgi:hypothetical protein